MRPARAASRLLVGFVVGAAVMFGARYWWTHAQVLEGVGSSWAGEAAVGQAEVVFVLGRSYDDETITVLDAQPRVARDGTAARYEFVTCVLKDRDRGIGVAGEAEVAELCASTEPGIGSSLGAEGGRGSQLLMKITATRPGDLELDGVDVTYRRSAQHLFQTGTQLTGMAGQLTAPAG